MKSIRRTWVAGLLVLVLAAVPTALAAAKELGSVTISGPGIDGQATISDPDGLMSLQQMGFFDTSTLLKVPASLGEGYYLTGYLNLDERVVPFVKAVYYPARAGQMGYIHYVGGYDGNTMQETRVDRWGAITPAAGALFTKLAAAQGLTLQTAVGGPEAKAAADQPLAAPLTPATQPDMRLALAVSAAVLLVAAALFARRRRTVDQG